MISNSKANTSVLRYLIHHLFELLQYISERTLQGFNVCTRELLRHLRCQVYNILPLNCEYYTMYILITKLILRLQAVQLVMMCKEEVDLIVQNIVYFCTIILLFKQNTYILHKQKI